MEVSHMCKFDRMVLFQFDIQPPFQACVPFKVPHLTLPAVSPTSVSSLPHLYTYTLHTACFLFLYACFSKSLPLVLSPSGPRPPQSLPYAVPCTLPWEYPFVPIPECHPKFSFQPSWARFTLTLSLLCVHSTPLPTHMPLFWS